MKNTSRGIAKWIAFLFVGVVISLFGCEKGTGTRAKTPIRTNLSPVEYVDPMIGTGGHGHTHPAATVPFGMVQVGPDTRLEGWDGCSGYHYSDSAIYGFSHTHLSGTGVSDYGDLLLVPQDARKLFDSEITPISEANIPAIPFSKSTEKASPGYYSVEFPSPQVKVQLTATERVGIHHYEFPGEEEAGFVLDLGHRDQTLMANIIVVDDHTLTGFRRSKAWAEEQEIYFRIEFSAPFTRSQVLFAEGQSGKMEQYFGEELKMLLGGFGEKNVKVKVAVSPVDIAGATANMEAEAAHWNFDDYREDAKKAWADELAKIKIEAEDSIKTIFYTGLYHAFLQPNLFSDVDGRYRGLDRKIHSSTGGDIYTVFSLWDTFRAAHPLYTMVQQKRTTEFIRTFLAQYEQSGRLPVWELAGNETDCMIGYHSISVIVDAWTKGLRDFDEKQALKAMVDVAEMSHFGLESYQKAGYVQAGKEPESVSKTLEYAYDDWCIATMAREMGEHDIAERFFARAQNWKNVFDTETGFMRARMNGLWFSPFAPEEVNFHYTEANAWQYSLFVPQDIDGLMSYMGGPRAMEKYLDDLFAASSETSGREQADITGLIGQYAHGNEPSHHMAYLYNFVGKPWKSQEILRQIMTEMYSTQPDGLSGNEDCGQMSAWYNLSAMGLYPVTPGAGYYVLGTPMVDNADISLENGQKFTIEAKDLSAENLYVQSVTLNGKPLAKSWVAHAILMQGGNLVFQMGAKPNESWGRAEADQPHTAINTYLRLPVPSIRAEARTFTDSLEVALGVPPAAQCRIYFTTDGTDPTPEGQVYTARFTIDRTTTVKAIAFLPNMGATPVIEATFYKVEDNKKIELEAAYAPQYNGGGPNALIDGLHAGEDFRTGGWQGFREDLKGVVEFTTPQKITKISLRCLQDQGSWILFPKSVRFSHSMDGKEWTALPALPAGIPWDTGRSMVKDFTYLARMPLEAKYIRFEAEHYGELPDGHLGAGGQAWIFADEITIE